MNFGKDFVWGVATAAYQIEGAWNEDGKGENIWDVFCHRPGTIKDGGSGDVACDSYHRIDEDLKLIQQLGVNAYRFSLSWARIIPDGTGKVNEAGIAYYNKVIDGLISKNILPYVTLYHWDLPQKLQEKGGFLNPEFPLWFENYASLVVERFGDRVKHFITFNEPQCIFGLGYAEHIHAPGWKVSLKESLLGVHNMLLAHGRAVKVLRSIKGVKVGYASCGSVPIPTTESEEDYKAAFNQFFDIDERYVLGSISLYSEPIFTGKYPEKYYKFYKEIMPEITEEDMKIISQPVDFFAQNTYEGYFVKAKRNEEGEAVDGFEGIPFEQGAALTPMNWHVVPQSLQYVTRYLYEKYKKPVFITENGISCRDYISDDGLVHDTRRSDFLVSYLKELENSHKQGVQVGGYFHWSFMDNFEWAEGYNQRFGLVYVDYANLRRIPKDSYYTYKKIIEESKGK